MLAGTQFVSGRTSCTLILIASQPLPDLIRKHAGARCSYLAGNCKIRILEPIYLNKKHSSLNEEVVFLLKMYERELNRIVMHTRLTRRHFTAMSSRLF